MVHLNEDADHPLDGERPVLILVHGILQSRHHWAPVRDDLRRIGPTIAVELVGHGGSPVPAAAHAYTLDAYFDHFREVLARHGRSRAWWVAFSLGARLVLPLAIYRPDLVEGLVLIGTGLHTQETEGGAREAESARKAAAIIEADGIERYVDGFLATMPTISGLPPEQVQAIRATLVGNDPVGIANSLRGIAAGVKEPVPAPLRRVRAPTLVVIGERDVGRVESCVRRAREIPGAVLKVIPGAGHPVFREKPEPFMAAVREFFAGL